MTSPPASADLDVAEGLTPEPDGVVRADADPPADTPGGVDLEFRPDVEGLRAVAIVLVVLFHCRVTSGGFVGVDVFFVISGFLITGLLIREHEQRRSISLPGFYARRARRILPAGMLVIILVMLAAHHYENLTAYNLTAVDGKFAALFAANIHFADTAQNYFDQGNPPSPLLHYWSLAVEEQFYFVWPTIVLVVGLLARWIPVRRVVLVTAAIGVVASFVWSLHVFSTNEIWNFYSPFTRAWELGLGAVAATLVALSGRLNRWVGLGLAWAGMAAICVAASTYSSTYQSAPSLLIPVLGTVAVIVGGASGIGAGHFLGLTPVRSVGRVSYGWYLLHYPPMILLTGILYQGPLPVHECLVIAVVTLGVAYVMYYVLEKPIRRMRYLAARPWVSIAMGLCFVLAAFLVCALYHRSLF